jgi:hypothetical protein
MKLLSVHLLIKKELLQYIYMKTGTKDGEWEVQIVHDGYNLFPILEKEQ